MFLDKSNENIVFDLILTTKSQAGMVLSKLKKIQVQRMNFKNRMEDFCT